MGQFAVPLAILGVGLIGEWLLGGTKSSTSKPDSMPALNNAIRGTPVPITFGSNRVASQVTWTKNFKATRLKGGGKGGKGGGGSGGLGSAKGGGSAAAGYEYFWDLKFDFGLMDTPVMARRGWIGSDVIDDSSMETLTAGGSALISGLFPPTSVTSEQSAKLKFSEAFIGQAFPTDSSSLTNWPYFEEQEGVACAWPYNAFVGFKQYDMGQSPAVPQLSFEWVPVNTEAAYSGDPTLTAKISTADTGNSWETPPSNTVFMIAGDKHYAYVPDSSGFRIFCPEDNSSFVVPTSAYTDIFAAYTAGGDLAFIPVPQTAYFIMWAMNTDRDVGGVIFQITDDGTYEIVNSFTAPRPAGGLHLAYFTSSGDSSFFDGSTLFVAGKWTDGLSSTQYAVMELPLGLMLEGLGLTLEAWDSYFNSLFDTSTLGSNPNFPWTSEGTTRNGFVTCVDADGVYVYYTVGQVAYMAANPGTNTIWDTISALGAGPRFVRIGGSATVEDLTSIGDFSDAGKNYDGTTSSSDRDDYSTPNASILPSADVVLTFVRGYTASGHTGDAKGFAYDLTQGQIVGTFGPTNLFNPADAGLSDTASPVFIQLGFDPTVGVFNYAWFGADAGTTYVFGQALTSSAGTDVTPAYIVYRILTDEVFGFATSSLFGFTVTADRINTASYDNAVAQCKAQGCFLSVTFLNSTDLLTLLNDLLALYGGYLTESDGIISFGVVDASETVVRTLDNNHFVVDAQTQTPVQVTKGALEDGYNKVVFNYVDRSMDYGTGQVTQSDEVDMDLNGPRIKTWDTKYVMSGSLATSVAVRALWANLYGKDGYSFTLGWKDKDLRPGDVVTLVDSFDPTLSGGVRARLTQRKAGSKRGLMQWMAVREYSSIVNANAVYTRTSSVDTGFGGLVEPVKNMIVQRAYELPQEFQGANPQVFFSYNQASAIAGAQLYLSTDGGVSFPQVADQQPYCLGGVFAQPMPKCLPGMVFDNVEFYILPTSLFSVETPTFTNEYDMDDVTPALRAAGAGVFIVGSEAVAFETLTLLGQNHYRARRVYRGWGGTPINDIASGAFFGAHGAGMFSLEITADQIGTTWHYKIAPYNFAGTVADISSIDAQPYTVRGLYWLPRIQPRTRIFVESAVSWPRSMEITGPYLGVASGGSGIDLAWPFTSNTEGFGSGGNGAGGYGHTATDSCNWRIDIASKNGTPVSSFVVTSPLFGYSVAQNSADFHGFGRDIILTVTPFTVKGDGPVADVRSLSLNW